MEVDQHPYWVPDEECDYCTACESQFGLLRRRHHCRLCGLIYCYSCSSARITNVGGASDHQVHRLCLECAEDLEDEDMAIDIPVEVLGPSLICGVGRPGRLLACIDPDTLHTVMLRRPSEVAITAGGNMSSSVYSVDTDSSTLQTCPVCSTSLERLAKSKAQGHISACLDKRRGSVIGSCYTISLITADTPNKECAICYEPFLKDQKCATLNCLCIFHQHCIDDWFQKKRACPLHFE